MSNKIRIVIADKFEIVREGIIARLAMTDSIDVVGEADDGFTALKLCRTLQPDIILMDLALTRPSGVETLAKIRNSCPDTKVVILSSEDTFTNAYFVLSKGAIGFMPKQAKGADFVSAITAAANGFTYLPTKFLEDFVKSRKNVSRSGNVFGLSPREIEILEACVRGQSTKEMANFMDISVRTVETHRNNIYKKTSCNNFDDLKKVLSMSG